MVFIMEDWRRLLVRLGLGPALGLNGRVLVLVLVVMRQKPKYRDFLLGVCYDTTQSS